MAKLYAVINADQRRSRACADYVDAALATLVGIPTALAFERTTGDEIQGAVETPHAIIDTLIALARLDRSLPAAARPGWHIGIGIGTIEDIDVPTTRAARGPAHLAARAAVDTAKLTSGQLHLIAPGEHAPLADDALALLRHVLTQRTAAGWEAVDLWRMHRHQSAAAASLGVSESAISQRLTRALWQEEDRAIRLAHYHLSTILEAPC